MATNYKINNVDIDSIYETFTTSVAQQYGVTDSKFTDSTAKFKKNRQPLKTAIGKTFPTSAGTHLGGSNTCTQYKVNGQPINVALKGCRPIGIPLATLSVGTHYINRVNGETWLSTSANSATGTRLDYNPKFIFVELQGGGGCDCNYTAIKDTLSIDRWITNEIHEEGEFPVQVDSMTLVTLDGTTKYQIDKTKENTFVIGNTNDSELQNIGYWSFPCYIYIY